MYIIIEHCTDGSFEPVSYLGHYDTKEEAGAALARRVAKVSKTYLDWRGIDTWYESGIYEDSAYCYLEGEGEVFTWYIFDVDKQYDINGYA